MKEKINTEVAQDFRGALRDAVNMGNIQKVEELLNLGTDPNFRLDGKYDAETLLHLAIKKGNYRIVESLIARGAYTDHKDYKVSPLNFAIEHGNLNIVKVLVDNGAEINTCLDADLMTPLMKAVSNGCVEIVYYLLKNGALVNGSTPLGQPIHFVVKKGDLIAQSILKPGISYNNTIINPSSIALPMQNKYNFSKKSKGEVNPYFIKKYGKLILGCLDSHWKEFEGSYGVDKYVTIKSIGETPLYRAIEIDRMKILKLLLEKGADINAQDADGNTLLNHAAINGRFKVAKFLLDKKADYTIKNSEGKAPIDIAIANERLDIALILLEKSIDIDLYDDLRMDSILNLLIKAKGSSKEKCLSILEILINHGANINVEDAEGVPLIYRMLEDGNDELEELYKKADFHLINKKKNYNNEFIKFLLQREVDYSYRDKDGNTLLHLAAKYTNLKIVQTFLAHGLEANATNFLGETPLHLAVKTHDYVQIARALIAGGANVNAQDNDGNTPLHKIIECEQHLRVNRYHTLCALLEAGADPNIANNQGTTPINYKDGYHLGIYTVEKLLEHGADVHAEDKKGNSFFKWVMSQPDATEFQSTYKEHYSNKFPNIFAAAELDSQLFEAVKENNSEAIEILLESGVNINCRDEKSNTPLHFAVDQGNLELAQLLIYNEALVNVSDESRLSPLHIAVGSQHLDIVELLVENGAQVNFLNKALQSPLQMALEVENLDITKLLLTNGADVHVKCPNGSSLLEQILMAGTKDIGELFLQHSKDFNKQESEAFMHYAVKRGDMKVLESLLNKGVDISAANKDGVTACALLQKFYTDADSLPSMEESYKVIDFNIHTLGTNDEMDVDQHEASGNEGDHNHDVVMTIIGQNENDTFDFTGTDQN